MSEYVWLIPALPGLAALINGLFGKWLKTKTAWIAIAAMLFTFVISFGIFIESVSQNPEAHSASVQKAAAHEGSDTEKAASAHNAEGGAHAKPFIKEVVLYKWFSAGALTVDIGFRADNLSIIMILFISFVGSLVFIYSTGYMRHHGKPDGGYARFFTCLSLFTFAMYLLVLGNNFVLMFVGWEGVGLCSYLLIGYYMDKKFAADAGKKAFIVNRIGDFGFLIGLFIIFWQVKSFNFTTVFSAAPEIFAYNGILITLATLALFLGACGKSAQIPLYIWLPDAMAGPTPVSALIHAATMVTAGVYMVARCNVLFVFAPITMLTVATVGAFTAIAAAFIALTQRDIKKVLAYSTVSQLGFMFLALGSGAFAAGIFHVFTHSFFKGCLFLCAGSVIHSLSGEQDMFKMGGLKKKMPITTWTYVISTLAIAGIPIWSGFFSKDEILWSAFKSGNYHLYAIGIITAFLTSFYMFRSVFLTFFGKTRVPDEAMSHVHESPKSMTFPLIILAFFATIAGFFNLPEFIAGKSSFALKFHHYLAPIVDEGNNILKSTARELKSPAFPHWLEPALALFSVVIALIGLAIARIVYLSSDAKLPEKIAGKFKIIHSISINKIYWDQFCEFFVGKGTMVLAAITGFVDKFGIDGIVNGAGSLARWGGRKIKHYQSGKVQDYALWILFAAVLLIFLSVVSAFELENFILR